MTTSDAKVPKTLLMVWLASVVGMLATVAFLVNYTALSLGVFSTVGMTLTGLSIGGWVVMLVADLVRRRVL